MAYNITSPCEVWVILKSYMKNSQKSLMMEMIIINNAHLSKHMNGYLLKVVNTLAIGIDEETLAYDDRHASDRT